MNILFRYISVVSLAILLATSATAATTEKTSKQKGIYDSVPLRKSEYDLLDTANEMEDQMDRRGLRYKDEALDDWLMQLGNSLAPATTDEYQLYRFYLLRDPSANAFAMPDGQIYVNTGLLARLENEAQLAALLSHEINHVAGHHGLIAYRSQKSKAITGLLVNIAGAAVGGWGGLGAYLFNTGLAYSIFGYSRALEEEADRMGYQLMLDAGYDVRELPKLFEVLGQDYEGLQPRSRGKWSTHPDLVIRSEYTTALVEKTPEDKIAELTLGDDDFRARVRPLAIMAVHDYILDHYPKSALELAQTLVDEAPNDPIGYVAVGHSLIALGARSEFSEDLVLTDKEKKKQARIRSKSTRAELVAEAERSPEAKANLEHNMAEAEKAYNTALELDSEVAHAYLGLGETYLRQERYQESARAFMQYLKLRPDAPDRPIVMDDLREVTRKLKAQQEE